MLEDIGVPLRLQAPSSLQLQLCEVPHHVTDVPVRQVI